VAPAIDTVGVGKSACRRGNGGRERVAGFELWVLGFGLKKETVFAFVTPAVFEPGGKHRTVLA
jgi:hypothetical protein